MIKWFMKLNSKQLNFILSQIEKKGFIIFDDLRNYFDDGKLSSRHLTSAKKSVKFLIKARWIKKKKEILTFTEWGSASWRIAKTPKLMKLMVEKGIDILIPMWNVFATKPRKVEKYEFTKRVVKRI